MSNYDIGNLDPFDDEFLEDDVPDDVVPPSGLRDRVDDDFDENEFDNDLYEDAEPVITEEEVLD